jgi:hypothetical protein
MLSVPIFALFPVAPPRLAGLGMEDTVSHQSGVVLTGHSTIFYNPLAAVPSHVLTGNHRSVDRQPAAHQRTARWS